MVGNLGGQNGIPYLQSVSYASGTAGIDYTVHMEVGNQQSGDRSGTDFSYAASCNDHVMAFQFALVDTGKTDLLLF